jgi:pimeloyl-ACP methyl ester carboxylesterase
VSPAAAGSRAAVRLAEAHKTLPPGAIDLACHAAVPVVVDPTFLNLLRINFFIDPPADLPWTVEAAVLTSPLFRELGGELFEIDEELRRALLVSLRTRYGGERVEQVALLLERYCDQPGVWGGQPHLARAQRLTVVGILDPDAAVGWLDDVRAADATDVELSSDWVVAMRGRLTAIPPADVSLDNEIAAAAERLRAGDPAARADLNALAMLPGSDVTAVRAALGSRPEGDEARRRWSWDYPNLPRVDFDPSFHRVDLTWGLWSDGRLNPLPLSGAVLLSDRDDNSAIELCIRLHNRGADVFVSVLEIDAVLRVKVIGSLQVPAGGKVDYAWSHTLDQPTEAQPHGSLSTDRTAPSPARVTVVFADTPIELNSLTGHVLTRDPAQLNDRLAGLAIEQAATIFPERTQPLSFAVMEIDYAVLPPPPVDIATESLAESGNPSLAFLEEAVADLRLLTVDNVPKLTGLAEALGVLAAAQAANGRDAEAVGTCEEAVRLCRVLAERNPDAHLPRLTMALGRLSLSLAKARRFEQALAAAQEAVQLSRESGDLVGLTSALDWWADLLAVTGRSSDAAGVRREAELVRRGLAAKAPQAGPAGSRQDPVETGQRVGSRTVNEERGGPDRKAGDAASDPSRDAVVFIPGLAGSDLVDAASGRMLWGTTVGGMLRMITRGTSSLLVTREERMGDTGRIVAPRLIGRAAVLPELFNLDPHGELVADLWACAANPEAVLEFPYDWRLSTTQNAKRLAAAARDHLALWRAHPAGSSDAKLTLVAHAFGGLVAMNYLSRHDGAAIVRRFVAIGTPFYGTVNAITSITQQNGAIPGVRGILPLYRSMPSIYDMLPSYRCVDTGTELRHLTLDDVAAIGGDRELAAEAFRRRLDPEAFLAAPRAERPEVTTVIGVDQPTPQTVRIDGGLVVKQNFINLNGKATDRTGDGVVYRDAATIPGAHSVYVSGRAGSLTRSPEVRAFIRSLLEATALGPPM